MTHDRISCLEHEHMASAWKSPLAQEVQAEWRLEPCCAAVLGRVRILEAE